MKGSWGAETYVGRPIGDAVPATARDWLMPGRRSLEALRRAE